MLLICLSCYSFSEHIRVYTYIKDIFVISVKSAVLETPQFIIIVQWLASSHLGNAQMIFNTALSDSLCFRG